MYKYRQKSDHCLNCGYSLEREENYCPNCGQENDQKVKPLGVFIKDFILEIVALDTRLFRSVKPFLFRPGRLTRLYLQGKRKDYIPPIRLYLIVSFFYFFLFSLFVTNQAEFMDKDSGIKSLREQILEEDKKNKALAEKSVPDSTKDKQSPKVVPDTLAQDSTQTKSSKKEVKKYRVNVTAFGYDVDEIVRLSVLKGMDEEEILDSLALAPNLVNRVMIQQTLKLSGATPKEIIKRFFDEIPIVMFFLIPMFALFLRILYFRRRYVMHLIFALHLHSFYFLAFGLIILWVNLLNFGEGWFSGILSLVLIFYTYKSFRNVYEQSRLLTLFKLWLLSFLYIMLLSLGLVLALILSVVFY